VCLSSKPKREKKKIKNGKRDRLLLKKSRKKKKTHNSQARISRCLQNYQNEKMLCFFCLFV